MAVLAPKLPKNVRRNSMPDTKALVMKLVLVVLTLAAQIGISADRTGSISGIVKDGSGTPAEGASVQAKNLESGLMVTVISQSGGKYSISNLPEGKYTVSAWGGGFESVPAENITVGAEAAAVNLTLSARQDFLKSRSITQQAELMPEGEGKNIMVGVCTDCHKYGLYEIISRRMDRNGWANVVHKMETNPDSRPEGPSGDGRVLLIWDREREQVLNYLAQNFGPRSPAFDKNVPGPAKWVKGPAMKAVVTEFPLPRGSSAHDVAVDSKGIGWISEGGHGVIGRFDPNTLTYTRIALPGPKSGAIAITVDPQDRVWVSDSRNNRLVRYDPKDQSFESYSLPSPPNGNTNANAIRFHPNGTVWFTEIGANQIVKLDPVTKKVTEYPVPSGVAAKQNINPYGMAIDRNGRIWVAERRADKLAAVDAKTGEIAEYAVPTRSAVLRRMGADAQGNLWFGEFGNVGKLAMVDDNTNKVTEYPTPTKYSGAYSVDGDLKRNIVWFNEMMADQIVRFDPRTKSFVEYPLPEHFSSIRRIELDRSRPNRIWFSGFYVDTVGYLDLVE